MYVAAMRRGITPDAVDRMDISVLAVMLGAVAAPDLAEPVEEQAPAEAPILLDDGTHAPATAPPGLKPPSWWKGNQAAFGSSVAAMSQAADMPGSMGSGGGP